MKRNEVLKLRINDVCETISRQNAYGAVGNTFPFKVIGIYKYGVDQYGKDKIYILVESLNGEIFSSRDNERWREQFLMDVFGTEELKPNQNVYSYKGIKLVEKKSKKVKVRRVKWT